MRIGTIRSLDLLRVAKNRSLFGEWYMLRALR
jgi:hypothetical protein